MYRYKTANSTLNDLKQYRKYRLKFPTKTELEFEQKLRDAKIKFLREEIFPPYILDFVVPKRKIIIELDGSSHIGREKYDLMRDNYLKQYGFTIIRLSNKEAESWDVKQLLDFPIKPKQQGFCKTQRIVNRLWRQRITHQQAELFKTQNINQDDIVLV
jgi:very-short-patch-repair endonuclease